MLFNLPNLVTWTRILLIPLIVGVFYFPDSWLSEESKNTVATAVVILAAVTDWLDGY
ncbi:MAG: CDP-alcohol phosphatidyltransferase family protein, partial [Rhodospirillales bacterium]|nr:CDP-alcohol phosphatidyltransferase family protein [Rhodospirillales bacterium]